MGAGAGARDQQDVRREVQQPGERDLHRRRAQPCRDIGQHGVGEQPAPRLAGHAQRAERHERYAARLALGEDVPGPLVGHVEEVLHTDDFRLGYRPQQVLPGDVAEPDAADQPFFAGPGQRRELGVEPAARGLGRVHDAQVHGREPGGAERDQVVLDAVAQLIGLAGPQQRAAGVGGGHLAHDREAVRVGVQRLADELVHRARAVVLRGVDVVNPGRDGRAQHPQRLVAIPRRPEHPVAGELHRAVPGTPHAPRAERERPARFLSVPGHAASCKYCRRTRHQRPVPALVGSGPFRRHRRGRPHR